MSAARWDRKGWRPTSSPSTSGFGSALDSSPFLSWETLDQFGIPCPPSITTASVAQALSFLSEKTGRAVVLKAVTQEHKARQQLVIMDIRAPAELERVWQDLTTRRTPPFLVQEQVAAGPELIVGFRWDPSFGGVVLLGFGGRFAERFTRREVRLAPLEAFEAEAMVVQLLGETLPALAGILINLSRLGMARDRALELDLNPVILSPDGPIAADLRVIEGIRPAPLDEGPGAQQAIGRMLQPRSVAIVGASANLEKPGGRALRYLRALAPSMPVYAVNPRRQVVEGIQTVAEIDDLPAGIDVAAIATPASEVVPALERLARRQVGSAVVFASGFGEVGNDAGEAEVRGAARRLRIRVCGVSSNGVIGDAPLTFSQAGELPARNGTVSYVAQSGAFGGSLLIRSWAVGLGTARYICVGNQTDLDMSDYLEFLARDAATRTIGVFLEGVRNGRRLADAMRLVTSAGKGLVVLRAGASAVAARAAHSHTATLAGSDEIYRQVIRGAGGALAGDLFELVGVCQALDWQPRAAGRRVAIISTSGGAGSLLADMAADRALIVPELEVEVQRELGKVLPSFASTHNPLDTTAAITYDPALLGKMAEPVLMSNEVDLLLIAISTLTGAQAQAIARDMVLIVERSSKPIVIGWSLPEITVGPAVALLRAARIPVFDSFALAASAAAALCPAPR